MKEPITKVVRALLSLFGAAGDKRRLNPKYVVDPCSRVVHRTGSRCFKGNGYTYSELKKAVCGVGADPCPRCLPDWEDILVREALKPPRPEPRRPVRYIPFQPPPPKRHQEEKPERRDKNDR